MPSAPHDEHGNPLHGTPGAVAAYDCAVDRLLRFHPDVLASAEELSTEHGEMAMGQALVAYLHLMSTDADDLTGAHAAAQELRRTAEHRRERLHAAAIDLWFPRLEGQLTDAGTEVDVRATDLHDSEQAPAGALTLIRDRVRIELRGFSFATEGRMPVEEDFTLGGVGFEVGDTLFTPAGVTMSRSNVSSEPVVMLELRIAELEQMVGKLTMQLEIAKKASRLLDGTSERNGKRR